MDLVRASLQSPDRIVLTFDRPLHAFSPDAVTFSPPLRIHRWRVIESLVQLRTDPVDIRTCRHVHVRGAGIRPLLPDGWFDALGSDAAMGCTASDRHWMFRLFAPRAGAVDVVLMRGTDDALGTTYALTPAEDGVWEAVVERDTLNRMYAYRITGAPGCDRQAGDDRLVGDPWASLVITRNTYEHEARAMLPGTDVIPAPAYDEGDAHVEIDPSDLIIYELHVRDMTAHPTSGAAPGAAGTYAALAHDGLHGGLSYIRSLGVNAVELLPVQCFAGYEPPYHERTAEGFFNTWNPYARNYWGYMPTYYFAPEPAWASCAITTAGAWNDAAVPARDELRGMIRAMHRAGLAVILDVVYNHTSQYGIQPLRSMDRAYFYHLDGDGSPRSASGCGNDLHTGRPMTRRLLIESLLHWLRYYRVDGFRFDLAALIDHETLEEAAAVLRAEFPGVLLLGEPWGGGRHDIPRLSELGMGVWNDRFRNGIKGWHPVSATGYVFGGWGASPASDFGVWVRGSVEAAGGSVRSPGFSVNYIESHDGYTFGDFVRLALGLAAEHHVVTDPDALRTLDERQLRIHRLAALLLLTSRGAVMLHAGQEFARSKIIADTGLPGTHPGCLDRDSYEKDDETNWIDYRWAEVNRSLVEYYRGLIRLRRGVPLLRHADPSRYRFLSTDVDVASAYLIVDELEEARIAVLVNGNHDHAATVNVPGGVWSVMVDHERADGTELRRMSGGAVTVPPCSGMVLLREGVAPGL